VDEAIKLGPATAGDVSPRAVHPRRERVVDLCSLRHADPAEHASALAEGAYELHLILNGHCRAPLLRHVRQLGAGHIVLCHADEADALTCSDDFDSSVVMVPVATVRELCVEHGWVRPEGNAAFSPAPLRPDERLRLLQLCQLVRAEIESDATPPEVLQHYARVLACKLIATLHQGSIHGEPDAQARCFARVVQYVDDNIRHDITAERLAQHAGLSVRSLYMLFEKSARMTPKAYIRKKKLEHVYSTLMDPASRVANVTAVALEFGFTHLGRFAELYRQTFGMLPSTSLKTRQDHHKVE
jgi:AraC-like DNA-binding protein